MISWDLCRFFKYVVIWNSLLNRGESEMTVKKLVAKEFECEEETTYTKPAGFKYTYLVDPETGRFYEPLPGWEVTGDDLEELFRETNIKMRLDVLDEDHND